MAQWEADSSTAQVGGGVPPDLTCLEDPAAGMPSGRYDLYALMEVDPGSGDERRFISVNVVQSHVYGSRG